MKPNYVLGVRSNKKQRAADLVKCTASVSSTLLRTPHPMFVHESTEANVVHAGIQCSVVCGRGKKTVLTPVIKQKQQILYR